MQPQLNRNSFLALTALFEGGLVVVALVLGWAFDVQPLRTLVWNWPAVGWGLLGVVPLYLGFLLCNRFPVQTANGFIRGGESVKGFETWASLKG